MGGYNPAVWNGEQSTSGADRSTRVGIGAYVIPADAIDDPDVTHEHQGTVWQVTADALSTEDGEVSDLLHTVKVSRGTLHFAALRSSNVGIATATDHATCDGLLKVAGKLLMREGRSADPRIFGVVHMVAGYLERIPKPAMASVFPTEEEREAHFAEHPEERAGWELRPKRTLAQRLCDRLDELDKVDGLAVSEIRRSAREQRLPYLDRDVDLSLEQAWGYGVLVAKWERHQTRRAAS